MSQLLVAVTCRRVFRPGYVSQLRVAECFDPVTCRSYLSRLRVKLHVAVTCRSYVSQLRVAVTCRSYDPVTCKVTCRSYVSQL
jgi:hypothetical protein